MHHESIGKELLM